MKKITKLWGSRFDVPPDKAAVAFAAGRDLVSVIPSDYNLLHYDIWLNQAHCVMLYKQDIIILQDAQIILKGLDELEKLTLKGHFLLDPLKEDVHTNVESWLIEKYGIDSCGKLHTARSRNDQVVTDTRLYLRDQTLFFIIELINLVEVLISNAKKYQNVVMPGFTHHQPAMITTFGHFLGSFISMFLRDIEKLKTAYLIMNTNPLGSTASFGTSFNIDRNLTTAYLGFSEPDTNSLDAITNRGEPEADLAYCLSSMMTHLSMFAESLIIFSTPQFSFITVSDSYSTGSSIMPQKCNPDMLEVMKGKTSYVHGSLMSLLSTGKSAFSGYNRDSQWTKYIIMDVVDACREAPRVMSGIIEELTVNKNKMEEWSHKAYIGATSFLELLCQTHNIPFRKGKIIVEKAIRYSIDRDKIDFIGLQQSFKEECVDVVINESTLKKWQDPLEIINLYDSMGSPGNESMKYALGRADKDCQVNKIWVKKQQENKNNALKKLDEEIEKILT